jgi:hypothetical protein
METIQLKENFLSPQIFCIRNMMGVPWDWCLYFYSVIVEYVYVKIRWSMNAAVSWLTHSEDKTKHQDQNTRWKRPGSKAFEELNL